MTESETKKKRKKELGCAFGAARLFITFPIWCYMLYRVLTAMELPQHVYAVFWVWMATGGIIALIELILNAGMDD